VVFAAYRNFPNSSNVLTKAAIFERPVLVSDGYLMAERVREFQLGEVVPEGDVEAIVQTLERMLAPGYYAELRQRARWADYREAHSTARLKKAMADLLEASLP
jgi:glycosyltransferase involved in cell wall biosynthesis